MPENSPPAAPVWWSSNPPRSSGAAAARVGDLGIWDDAFVEPLARLVKFIKQQNSVAGIQLGHSGRKARANRPWEGDGPLQRTPEIDDWEAWSPVAPSAIAHSEKWPVPKALERHEVKDHGAGLGRGGAARP